MCVMSEYNTAILSEVDVYVTFNQTIYNYVFEADFTNRTEKKCNVVHVIPCHSCPELCIGQTSANCR